METKKLRRTISYLDDALEQLVVFNMEHQLPDIIFDNIGKAIAALDQELNFDDDERVEAIDFRKASYTKDPYEEDY